MKDESIGDALIALLRTVVPMVVGWVLARLALPPDVGAQVELLMTAVITAGYYALIRALSARWRGFGWLLGYPSDPHYEPRHSA